jgi:hypothetical protein
MTARLANPAAAKDPRKTWYSLQLWKNRRAHQLLVEPLCVLCEAEGRVTGAGPARWAKVHYFSRLRAVGRRASPIACGRKPFNDLAVRFWPFRGQA